jgi:hypothetical protein
MRIAFDAAYPPASVPGSATTAAIYIGGDTPNPIADPASVPAYQAVKFWLPIWVRSNPTPAIASADAAACLNALDAMGAPATCSVVLDLETAVTRTYVLRFALLVAPHPVLPYGSRSTLMQNPRCAGYFLAWPTWTGKTWPPNVVAIQHTYAGSFDLSTISTSVALWAHVPVSTSRGLAVVEVPTGPHGDGWVLTSIPWSSFIAATIQGSDPAVDGRYWPGCAHVQERTERVLVSVTGCLPLITQTVFVART